MDDGGSELLVPDDGDELPEDLIEVLEESGEKEFMARIIGIAKYHSGPLPSPEILAKYKDVQHDAPDRILKMAERQQDHRMELEQKVIMGDVDRADRGLLFGFILFFSFGIGAIILLAIGKEIGGYTLLGTSLIGGIANFIRVGRERKKELDERSGGATQKVAEKIGKREKKDKKSSKKKRNKK